MDELIVLSKKIQKAQVAEAIKKVELGKKNLDFPPKTLYDVDT
ncbi:MAG: hypothetical protein AABY22_15945 [Nanoarchaeota archaeon]